MAITFVDEQHQNAWLAFAKQYELTSDQEHKFDTYLHLLLQENEKYNITAITNLSDVVSDHFFDSLAILKLHDMSTVKSLVDVGTGGGFPGLALAIMLPQTNIQLVEVNLKKVHFLNLVITTLGLTNVHVSTDDWRNFLRIWSNPVDMVVARASLPVTEILRMFKPSSMLKNSIFVYWASKKWVPTPSEKEYLKNCATYDVGQKQRSLCFFNNK